jgi:hypothetical protein
VRYVSGFVGIGISVLLAERYADARWYSSPARFRVAHASSGERNSGVLVETGVAFGV